MKVDHATSFECVQYEIKSCFETLATLDSHVNIQL